MGSQEQGPALIHRLIEGLGRDQEDGQSERQGLDHVYPKLCNSCVLEMLPSIYFHSVSKCLRTHTHTHTYTPLLLHLSVRTGLVIRSEPHQRVFGFKQARLCYQFLLMSSQKLLCKGWLHLLGLRNPMPSTASSARSPPGTAGSRYSSHQPHLRSEAQAVRVRNVHQDA